MSQARCEDYSLVAVNLATEDTEAAWQDGFSPASGRGGGSDNRRGLSGPQCRMGDGAGTQWLRVGVAR